MPCSLSSATLSSLHCCSVETVPTSASPGGGGGIFALGMYELNEETTLRNGAIALYNRDSLVSTRPMESGVLDMKFHNELLACAMSSGDVELLTYDHVAQDFAPGVVTSVSNPDEGLALSVDWSRCEGSDNMLAVSTQEGSVLVYDVLSTGLEIRSTLQNVHSLFGENIPAWITAFNPHSPMMLVSGGDDCCLKLWDLRSPEQPVQNMAKFFTAGVTSAQWCPHRSQEHIYAVGSYDGSIALWDERMMRRTPLASVDSGGGVWRLKWNPDIDGSNDGSLYLGAASMHNGSGIYKIDPGSSFASDGALELTTFEIQQDVNEKRLVYGMDWLTKQAKSKIQEKDTVDEDNTDSNTIFKSVELNASASIKQRDFEIATCSFYDNLVQIWSC